MWGSPDLLQVDFLLCRIYAIILVKNRGLVTPPYRTRFYPAVLEGGGGVSCGIVNIISATKEFNYPMRDESCCN